MASFSLGTSDWLNREEERKRQHLVTGQESQLQGRFLNDKILEARDIALKILKPSKKELEHGLELHRNSLVFDTYGFMPRAAYDGAKIATAIAENASVLEINDLEEDHHMTRCVDIAEEREEFVDAFEAAGVTCIFQNAGEESNSVQVLLKRLARFTYVTDMMPDFVKKGLRANDTVKAKSENRHLLYFSGNGVPMPLDMISLEEELRYIKVFYQLGIRMMHLTYNRRNLIGDGCGETSDAGLSDFGRAVVREMNNVGILVDIAHSGWQTSLEAALLSERPIVASHTTCAAINRHIRSKPDNVIDAIIEKEGYIGICCIPRFLGGTGTIQDMMKHIDYMVKKYGPEYVGIGTDVVYVSRHAPEQNRLIPERERGRMRWEALWPPDSFKESEEMRKSMAWTNWPLFTVGLVQMGYSDVDIQKVIGGNALRVLDAVANK
ncbi:MAG: membrane dipeptidase [Saprospiraceae bacterium]|nr:membrane dipeptidase [Saprospiraceae bacterium]